MSDANRVFSRQPRQATSSSQTRHIVTAPRKNSHGTVRSRVVEVVHVARRSSGPVKDQPSSTPWHAHVEAWPNGFRAKPPAPALPEKVQPTASEIRPPTVHVMPAWEPSVQQPASADAEPVEGPNSTQAVEGLDRCDAKPRPPKMTVRRFADPFADGDDGANCIRCGYLVERAQEARGLWTCSKCN